MQTDKIKKLSMHIMIAGLIGAAAIAVVTILAGSFNDTSAKALMTLFLVMFHALVSLAFIEHNSKNQNNGFKFFENVVLVILVLSFFTSVLGVWELLAGNLVGNLYGTYSILVFACLHGQMLYQTKGKQSNIDNIVYVNYAMMSLVIVLLLPLIWLTEVEFVSFYYRLLAACGIIDATLTILAVILHRMYIQKHPEAQSQIFSVTTTTDANGQPVPVAAELQKRHAHPLLWLLGIFLIGQILLSAFLATLGRL